MNLRVVVASIRIGVVNGVLAAVGSEPSVVKKTVAGSVAASVTNCGVPNRPGSTLATASNSLRLPSTVNWSVEATRRNWPVIESSTSIVSSLVPNGLPVTVCGVAGSPKKPAGAPLSHARSGPIRLSSAPVNTSGTGSTSSVTLILRRATLSTTKLPTP
jgi:hypothetical protein